MNAEKVWDNLKNYIAVLAAIMLWLVSMAFFMIGFSVASGGGMYLPNISTNVGPIIAFTISIVNTFIQITWNGPKDDWAEWGLWGASYLVGVLSNYLGLLQIFNMQDPMIEKGLALAIGIMIEVAPEKLLLRGLREIKLSMPKIGRSSVSYRPQTGNRPNGNQQGHNNQHSAIPMNQSQPKQQQKPGPTASTRPLYNEPTYRSVGTNTKPEFRPTNYQEE